MPPQQDFDHASGKSAPAIFGMNRNRSKFEDVCPVRLDLPASDDLSAFDRHDKTSPIQTHWIDSHQVDQPLNLGRLRFERRANFVSAHTAPEATRMTKVEMNQWMRKGQKKDFVRYATHPKANPPKMVESVSMSGLPMCASAKGTA